MTLKPFESDGCSVVGPIVRFLGYENAKIRDCCEKHDRAYWKGGTAAEKRRADRVFRGCLIREAGMTRALAWIMWIGVVVGGSIPHTKFRWGFGRVEES